METLILICIVGVASALLEGIILAKFKPLATLLTKRPWLSLPVSFGLSWLLGLTFGAKGLIVLAAGVLSTVLMQPVYWLRSKMINWWRGREDQSSPISADKAAPNWTVVGAKA